MSPPGPNRRGAADVGAERSPLPLERREVGRQELLGVELLRSGEALARIAPLQRCTQAAGRAHPVEPVERVGVRRDAGDRDDPRHSLGEQRGAGERVRPSARGAHRCEPVDAERVGDRRDIHRRGRDIATGVR